MDLEIHQINVLTKGLARDWHERFVIAYGLKGFGSTQSGSIEAVDEG
jgi:hypothetical protein